MDDETVESQDLQETTEDTTTSQPTVDADEQTEETVDWEAKAKELEAKNKQLFERNKKLAEAKKSEPQPTAPDLSGKDILALSASGITEDDDIELVKKAAKLNGTTIAQAVKDPIVQGLLKGQKEERQTAQAASTSNTRRAPTERSGADLLRKAKSGTMPDSKADIQKLVRARIGIKD